MKKLRIESYRESMSDEENIAWSNNVDPPSQLEVQNSTDSKSEMTNSVVEQCERKKMDFVNGQLEAQNSLDGAKTVTKAVVEQCERRKMDEVTSGQPKKRKKKKIKVEKRERYGHICVICDKKNPSKNHVNNHFGRDYFLLVENLPNPMQCPECSFLGDTQKNAARHVALVHPKLDEFTANSGLVQRRRMEYQSLSNTDDVEEEESPLEAQTSLGGDDKSKDSKEEESQLENSLGGETAMNKTVDPKSAKSGEVSQLKAQKSLTGGETPMTKTVIEEYKRKKMDQTKSSKSQKVTIGWECPVCDKALTKDARVHGKIF